MPSIQTSHIIASEPRISRVPVSNTHNSNDLSLLTCSMSFDCDCSCPNVLIADDDSFQHLYYQSLFTRSLDFDQTSFLKHDFRFQLCFSGEEMLQALAKTRHCGCGKLSLVITDYSMGSDKLNGVQTILNIRQAGYKGNVVLRTSETQEYLKTRHVNFEGLIKNGTISTMLDKDNMSMSKKMIQKYLKKAQ